MLENNNESPLSVGKIFILNKFIILQISFIKINLLLKNNLARSALTKKEKRKMEKAKTLLFGGNNTARNFYSPGSPKSNSIDRSDSF